MEVPLLFPTEVHNQFLSFADVQQEVVFPTPVLQVGDLPPVGCLVVVGDESYNSGVVSKLDEDVGV